MRLLDADALKEKAINVCYEDDYESEGFGVVYVRHIDEAPTIDAVPVVRCKDCKNYCGFERCKNGICDIDSVRKRAVYPDDFCSRGERIDNGIL